MIIAGVAEVCLNENLELMRGGGFLPSVPATGTLDNLYASAFALDDGAGTQLVWAGCDLGLIPDVMYANISRQVHAATGIPQDNVLVSATHTHSGPNVLEDVFFYESAEAFYGQAYIRELERRIAQACINAWETRRPMRIGAASSTVNHCNGNRRYLMSDGTLKWQPVDTPNDTRTRILKEGPEDKHVQVVWFASNAGDTHTAESMADIQFVIVNFTAHPANYYGSPQICADYPGVIRRMIKDWIGDVPMMFLQGCLGNVHCIDYDRQDWFKNALDRSERIGRVLGAEAIKQMLTRETRALENLHLRFASTRLPLPYRDVPEAEMQEALDFAIQARLGDAPVPAPETAAAIYRNNLLHRKRQSGPHNNVSLNVLRMGDILFATNPAELFVEYQLQMREAFPGKILLGCSCTNGHAFYVPTRKAHVFGGYETRVCQLQPDAGENITAVTIELANSVLNDSV